MIPSAPRRAAPPWNPWYSAAKSGFASPYSYPLHPRFFPATFLRVHCQIDNRQWSLLDTTALGLLGAAPMSSMTDLSRGWGTGPRYGFSIGNIWKHQMRSRGYISGMGFAGVWLAAFGELHTYGCSNCRLRQMYLKHGKILSSRVERGSDGEIETIFVKVFNKEFSAPENIFLGITVYGIVDGEYSSKSFSGDLNENWELEIDCDDEDSLYLQNGNFFELNGERVLCVEDPALMHEFGLTDSEEDGIWRTFVQRMTLKAKPLGTWALEEYDDFGSVWQINHNEGVVNVPDENDKFDIWMTKEHPEKGSDVDAGFDDELRTVRIAFGPSGGQGLENFCAENLVGEFVQINNEMYEIVGHPRGDTIEILKQSVTSDEVLDGLPEEMTIFQQKFWMTVDQYVGYFRPLRSDSDLNSSSGSDFTNDEVEISWKSPLVHDRHGLRLLDRERSELGVSSLVLRHLKIFSEPSKCIKAYEKFERWKLLDGENAYNIKSVDLNEDTMQTTVTINENQAFKFFPGARYSVSYDMPFFDFSSINPGRIYAEFRHHERNQVWMAGYYDFAKPLRFSPQISRNRTISVVSQGSTVQSPGHRPHASGFMNPYVWLSTLGKEAGGVSVCRDLNGHPLLFFNCLDSGLLLYMSVNTKHWTGAIRMGLVRLSPFLDFDEDDIDGMSNWFVSGVVFESPDRVSWIYAPSSGVSPFYSKSVLGENGFDTPFFKSNGMDKIPIVGANFPIEVYPENGLSFVPFNLPARLIKDISLVSANANHIYSPQDSNVDLNGDDYTSLQFSYRTKLILNGSKFVFLSKSGKICILYGSSLIEWNTSDGVADKEDPLEFTNTLSLIWTKDHCYLFDGVQKDTDDSYPLILLLDFDFRGAAFNPKNERVVCCGYISERDEGYPPDDLRSFRLAIYSFSLSEILNNIDEGDCTELSFYGGEYPTAGYLRHSKFLNKMYDEEFGKDEVLGVAKVESANESSSEFFNIISSPIEDFVGIEDKPNISIVYAENKISIYIYLKDFNNLARSGLARIFSDSDGQEWNLEKGNDGELILYVSSHEEILPCDFFNEQSVLSANYLFYIERESLWMKNLEEIKGDDEDLQERLNNLVPILVSDNVSPQKASIVLDEHSFLIAYYVNIDGDVTAKISKDQGRVWDRLSNF